MPAVNTLTYSDFVSGLDLHEEQIDDKLYKRYGDQGLMYMFMRALGFEGSTAGRTYGHFEEDYTHDVIKQKTGTSSSALGDGTAQGIRVTLDPSKVDSDGHFYARVGDQVLFPADGQTGWIDSIDTSGSDPLLDIYSDDGAAISALSGGEELIIFSAEFPEASGMPDEASSKALYFDNDVQIIKEAVGATGDELTNENRIAIMNQAGEFQGWYRKSQDDLDYRMMLKMDGAFVFGKRGTSTKVPSYQGVSGDTYKNYSTQGLVNFIENNGHSQTYPYGSFAASKFDTWDQLLAAEYLSTNTPMWMPMGLKMYQDVQNGMQTKLQDTNINYAKQVVNDMLFKGDESKGATFNFKYYQGTRLYMFSLLGAFSNPKTYGSADASYDKWGFIIPLRKGKDPKTKNDVPSIGIKFKRMGAYDRKFITDSHAGIGAALKGERTIHTLDKRQAFMFTQMGAEFFGGNSMVIIKPA